MRLVCTLVPDGVFVGGYLLRVHENESFVVLKLLIQIRFEDTDTMGLNRY
jgi:hypothetical protein